MKSFFQLLILLFSLALAENHFIRCGIHNELNDTNRLRSRPQKHTYSLSPNEKFKVHYDTSGVDAPNLVDINNNSIPDYIDEVGLAAEYIDSILVQVYEFLPVTSDEDNIYDIYISDLGSNWYGNNDLDYDSLGEPIGTSYIRIDNEYEADGDYYTHGVDAMKVTLAHEYFHAIQRSYNIKPYNNVYFYELFAVWIEDIIYPDINDYINTGWLSSFYNEPEQMITSTDGYSIGLYAHYLTSVLDEDSAINNSIIKKIWNEFSDYNTLSPNSGYNAINSILESDYSTSFINTWVEFCTRNLWNGIFDSMDNNFYYYEDQIYAMPIQNNGFINLQNSVSEVLFFDNKSIRLNVFLPTSSFFINIENTNSDIISSMTIGSTQDLPYSYSSLTDSSNYIYVNELVDQIYIVSGSDNQNEFNLDLTVLPYNYGDINQNNFIDVVDIIYIINYIFDVGELTEFQIILADINLDRTISISDIIAIVNIITN